MLSLRNDDLPPEYRMAELKCLHGSLAVSNDNLKAHRANEKSDIREKTAKEIELFSTSVLSSQNLSSGSTTTMAASTGSRIREATRRYNIKLRRARLTQRHVDVSNDATQSTRKQ
ncbi:U40-like protein [Lissonota sp. PSUC_FEM 10030012]|nr:U40-like protein [Lissonota sp. PSUC_FEM 10030012]